MYISLYVIFLQKYIYLFQFNSVTCTISNDYEDFQQPPIALEAGPSTVGSRSTDGSDFKGTKKSRSGKKRGNKKKDESILSEVT